jgi:hypothetical protein
MAVTVCGNGRENIAEVLPMKQLTSMVVLVVYLINLGCYSTRQIPPAELTEKDVHVLAAVYPSGEVVTFKEYVYGAKAKVKEERHSRKDRKRGAIIDPSKRTVEGTTVEGTNVSIPLDSLLYVRVKRVNKVKTTIVVVMAVGIMALIIGASLSDSNDPPTQPTPQTSCPIIYSFNGSEYVLDAEPLGGALAMGLERGDLSRLEHLEMVDGKYRVLARNENKETQYLNEVKLLVADHPAHTRVAPDLSGSLHVIGEVAPPLKATDESGRDIGVFFDAPDDIMWQTRLPIDESWRQLPRRHELTFEFPRPRGATSANVVVKAGTAPWGTEMMPRMLAVRGDGLAEWYRSVDSNGAAMSELIALNEREELYLLKLYVLVGEQWVHRAWIPGGGPLVAEERVIPVDLSGVSGDVVKMRVLPPRGFWSFDFLGLQTVEYPPPVVTGVPLEAAVDHNGANVTADLSGKDDRWHAMPAIGDEITLSCRAPSAQGATSRTVFIDIHGYYQVHVDQTRPEQTELIADLVRNEGSIVEYSLDQYMSFRTKVLSGR